MTLAARAVASPCVAISVHREEQRRTITRHRRPSRSRSRADAGRPRGRTNGFVRDGRHPGGRWCSIRFRHHTSSVAKPSQPPTDGRESGRAEAHPARNGPVPPARGRELAFPATAGGSIRRPNARRGVGFVPIFHRQVASDSEVPPKILARAGSSAGWRLTAAMVIWGREVATRVILVSHVFGSGDKRVCVVL